MCAGTPDVEWSDSDFQDVSPAVTCISLQSIDDCGCRILDSVVQPPTCGRRVLRLQFTTLVTSEYAMASRVGYGDTSGPGSVVAWDGLCAIYVSADAAHTAAMEGCFRVMQDLCVIAHNPPPSSGSRGHDDAVTSMGVHLWFSARHEELADDGLTILQHRMERLLWVGQPKICTTVGSQRAPSRLRSRRS